MSSKPSIEETPRFVGNKPALALRRFANDLETSSDPDRKKFQELNKSRKDNFIRAPYDNTVKYRENFKPSKPKAGKKGVYDYSDKTEHFSLHLDAPELQRYLLPIVLFDGFDFFPGIGRSDQDHGLEMVTGPSGTSGSTLRCHRKG